MEMLTKFKMLTPEQVADIIYYNIPSKKTKAYETLLKMKKDGDIKSCKNHDGKLAYYINKKPVQKRHCYLVADAYISIFNDYFGEDSFNLRYDLKFETEYCFIVSGKLVLRSDLFVEVVADFDKDFYKSFLVEVECSANPPKNKIEAYNKFYVSEANLWADNPEDFPLVVVKTYNVTAFKNAVKDSEINPNGIKFLILPID